MKLSFKITRLHLYDAKYKGGESESARHWRIYSVYYQSDFGSLWMDPFPGKYFIIKLTLYRNDVKKHWWKMYFAVCNSDWV